jgi:hypothetical protein
LHDLPHHVRLQAGESDVRPLGPREEMPERDRAQHATAGGFGTDAGAIEHAFRLLMRMRNAQRPAPGGRRI